MTIPEGRRSAVLLGGVVAFVAAVNLIRQIRLDLLLSPESSWLFPRLLLGVAVVSGSAAAGGITAALFSLWSRARISAAPLERLPVARLWLIGIAGAAVLAGAAARLASLDSVPEGLWVDEVAEIRPALALSGRLSDFADSIRPVPFGQTPTGTVGVLYLELFRGILRLFHPGVFSLRLPATLAGIASLITAGLLARRLLPSGGAVLTVLVLSGLNWHLALSRLCWVAIVIAPLVSIATLIILLARARENSILAAFAGLVIGAGAHIYLSAWVGATALLALTLWPLHSSPSGPRSRFKIPVFFAVGFVVAVSPLFLLHENGPSPSFLRTRHVNVLNEVRYWQSPMPVFEAAADGLTGPWHSPPWRRWPGNVRLGAILASLLAVGFFRALRRPRDEFSAVLLSQSVAPLAATVLGGHRGVPNGFRFGYLSELSAVAISGGACWILLSIPASGRRIAAIVLIGILSASSIFGIRRFFLEQEGPAGDPSGQDTLVARAALRWERYGIIEFDPGLIHSHGMVDAIRRYRLDPRGSTLDKETASSAENRNFRIARPDTIPRSGERRVEILPGRDNWGFVVYGISHRSRRPGR